MIAKVIRMNEFRRMMQRVLKSKWKESWVSGCLVLLFTGLLFSRALVSFASVLVIVPFFANYRQTSLQKLTVAAVGLILLPVIISGFWSDDKTLWWNSVSVKLPLITMMLGLSAAPVTAKRWKQLSYLYILIITAGCAWSFGQYIDNLTAIEAAYLKAKVLPTLADADYIRFSWMVVIAILLGIKCLESETNKIIRNLFSTLLLLLVLYLHLLASKTGLLCLYAGILVYLAYIFFIEKKWKRGLATVAVFSVIALFAYNTMPTLRNRVQYVVYDFSNYSKGNLLPGYNDAARWLSIRAGYSITQQHPLTGVGFGDILTEVNRWHQQEQPGSFAYERFLPACEWLVYGAGSGWPGLLCFTAGIVLLVVSTTSKNNISVILSITTLIPLLTDDTLEGQYGVILLAFIAFFGQQKFLYQLNNT